MKLPVVKSFVAIGFILLLSVSQLFAQVYLTEGWHWARNYVIYHVNENLGINSTATQQQWETAIDSAAAQWDNAGANFRFIKGTDVDWAMGSEPTGGYQLSYNYISGSDDVAVTSVIAESSDYYPADTLVSVETYFNTYYDFVPSPPATASNDIDIRTDAVHELGHWLDLEDEQSDADEV